VQLGIISKVTRKDMGRVEEDFVKDVKTLGLVKYRDREIKIVEKNRK